MLQTKPGVQKPHWEPPRTAISCWTGCRAVGVPRPSAVTTSWPSSPAAGARQALMATHSVGPATPGRATKIEQAPHSPSAQPSLQPANPRLRRNSSADVWVGTPESDMD
jgi:hypothetical protein